MKKYALIIISAFLFLTNFSIASETDDWGENTDVFTKGHTGQKQISDGLFKKTVKEMQERSLNKKQKKIKEEVQPNSPNFDEEHLKMFTNSQDPDDELSQTLTVMIPVSAFSEDGKNIQPGYYKLSCKKLENNDYVLELSQGIKKVLSVKAEQTQEDLEQDTIQFCNAEIISNNRIRLMYGSINLNLTAYLYY